MRPAGVAGAEASAAAERAFDTLADTGWHVAKLRLGDGTVVLRCCLMKAEHEAVALDLAAALGEHLARAAANP